MRRGYDVYNTPLLGSIYMIVSELGVERIFLTEEMFKEYQKNNPGLQKDEGLCKELKQQLEEYFKGTRQIFDVPIVEEGTTFQKQVWKALREVPYGGVISYGEIAKAIHNPKACRAVGGANRANKLPLIIPCHRVIGKNGALVGFMGQEGDQLGIKSRLLAHETRYKTKSKK